MQCNIDSRGRAVRLIWGILTTLAAAIVGGLTAFGVLEGWWCWPLTAVLGVLGLLGIYEGRAGWCVVRAMGIKTPM